MKSGVFLRTQDFFKFFQIFFLFFLNRPQNSPKNTALISFSCLKFKHISILQLLQLFLKTNLLQCPPVLASNIDRPDITPNKRLFSHVLSVACQHTTNRGGSRFFTGWLCTCEILRRIGGALPGWVLSVTDRRGFLKEKHRNPKMSSETIHRCSKCGIIPVYQTARVTEERDDIPNVVYRLQCPICGRYGAYCTTKQLAIGYWNREPFIPPRGRRK